MTSPDWMADAACRGMDPNLFHPHRGQDSRAAKTVCSGCPVRVDCAEYAVTNNQHHGVWGMLSERQRYQLRRSRGLTTSRHGEPPHGSVARYRSKAYRCRCGACAAAHARWRTDTPAGRSVASA